MTANDLALIEKAKNMNCIFWGKIDSMQNQADTEEAKQELRNISKWKYHEEEFISDIL